MNGPTKNNTPKEPSSAEKSKTRCKSKTGGGSPSSLTDDKVTEQPVRPIQCCIFCCLIRHCQPNGPLCPEDTEGHLDESDELYSKRYNTEWISLPFGEINIMENQICCKADSHQSSTLKKFRRYGYEARVRRIKVTVQLEDLREDDNANALIVRFSEPTDELILQKEVLFLTFHRQYCSAVV